MMSYYKVKYKIDTYNTPHYRFYTATTPDIAQQMFTSTCETTLGGSDIQLIDVVEVIEKDSDIVGVSGDCDTGNCCNN